LVPSSAFNLLKAGTISTGYTPGLEVCILTLRASHGQRRVSAITSAQAEEIAQQTFLFLLKVSYPSILIQNVPRILALTSLKNS
jgi:hypothetical protein